MINKIIENMQQDLSQILTENQMEALSQVLNKHLSALAVDNGTSTWGFITIPVYNSFELNLLLNDIRDNACETRPYIYISTNNS